MLATVGQRYRFTVDPDAVIDFEPADHAPADVRHPRDARDTVRIGERPRVSGPRLAELPVYPDPFRMRPGVIKSPERA